MRDEMLIVEVIVFISLIGKIERLTPPTHD
jgi:hypothetical protein